MCHIIVLSSGLHGSGRSRISEELKKLLKGRYSIYKISSGDIFREIAKERGYQSIDDFISEITKNPELALEIDVEVDKRMMEKTKEFAKEYDFIIIDSNLAPYYLGNSSLRLIIFAKPEIAAERVFKNSRIMDKKYSSIEEVKNSLIERTKDDVERYKILSKKVKDDFLKRIYETGAKIIEKLLNYILSDKYNKIEEDEEIMQYFDGVVDNNGSIENTLRQVMKYIKKKFGVEI